MTYKLGTRSLKNLEGVHPVLQRVVKDAIELTKQDFTVIEGLRTFERQKELFEQKKTKTMNSRHLKGYAVDIIPYGVPDVWNTKKEDVLKAWLAIRWAMFQAAKKHNTPLRWGGDWNGDGYEVGNDNWDMPHYELPAKNYP